MTEENRSKTAPWKIAAVSGGLYLALALVNLFPLSSLYEALESDVVIRDTLWPTVVYALMNALDLLALGVFYGVLCRCLSSGETASFYAVSVTHAAVAFIRYALTPLAGYGYDAESLSSVVLAFIMEMAVFGLSTLVLRLTVWKFPEHPAVSAVAVGLLEALFLIGSRILFDIDYGAPESGLEVASMVLGYASDLLAGAFLAAVVAFTIIYFRRKR